MIIDKEIKRRANELAAKIKSVFPEETEELVEILNQLNDDCCGCGWLVVLIEWEKKS